MAFDSATPSNRKVGIRRVKMASGVVIVEPANVYECHLAEDCFVGPFTEIQRGVTVGARSRIQSHSFVCELVSIGEDCVVGHGVMFINDLYREGPARGDRSRWAETSVGDRVYIGSNATILPVNICSDVVIGAGSVVTRDINEAGTYAGNPARRLAK